MFMMFLESNLMDIEKTLAVCVYLRNKHQVKVFESLELNLVGDVIKSYEAEGLLRRFDACNDHCDVMIKDIQN